MRRWVLFLLAMGLSAQEPSLAFQVKFLKILMSATSQYGIACKDTGVKASGLALSDTIIRMSNGS
jgi:hypothetical protein